MIKKKEPLVHIPHWRDKKEIKDRIKEDQKKNNSAAYADTMRKLVRDGLEANENE